MSAIGQATTPTFICTVPNSVDLTAAQNVYFTMMQLMRKITKSGTALTVDPHSVSVYLDQSETVGFSPSFPVELQLNWTYEDGSRGMTKIVTVTVDRNLVPEVLA